MKREQPFEGTRDLSAEDVNSSRYKTTLSSQWNLFNMIYNLMIRKHRDNQNYVNLT